MACLLFDVSLLQKAFEGAREVFAGDSDLLADARLCQFGPPLPLRRREGMVPQVEQDTLLNGELSEPSRCRHGPYPYSRVPVGSYD